MDAFEQEQADREILAKHLAAIDKTCSECGYQGSTIVYENGWLAEQGAYTIVCKKCPCETHVPAEATARSRIGAIRAIVREHSAKRVDGYIVDAQTAGMLVAVYEALSPESREKFGAVPLMRLVDFGWKAVK